MNSSANDRTQSSIMDKYFLQATPCLYEHVYALLNQKDAYLHTLDTLCSKGLIGSTSQAIKARIIAALHIAHEHGALKSLLVHCEVVEILKALSVLDRPRQLKQLLRKVQAIERRHPHVAEAAAARAAERPARLGDRPRGRKHGRRQRALAADAAAPEEVESRVARRQRMRGVRLLRTRIKELEDQGDHLHTSGNCAGHGTAHSDTAVREMIESSSVSGALALKIREWARTHLRADFLEFAVLSMPVDQWKRLADLVHFHPSDFALPYFLGHVYGGELPKDSFPGEMREFLEAPWESRPALFKRLAERHPQAYLNFAYLRTLPQVMSGHASILEMLAQNIPLNLALWYLEELAGQSSGDAVPKIVARRIQSEGMFAATGRGDKVTSLGKLVERILTFQARKWQPLAAALLPAAEQRLGALKEEWLAYRGQGRTVVFGDASASMQTAIQAATILASMIAACFDGELSFFQGTSFPSPHPRPGTVDQVLDVCRKVKANNCTSLASALWPYYEKKTPLDRIVMVTDEGENTECHGYNFARLLQTYRREVKTDVELIIVGVGSGYGPFRSSLASCEIPFKRVEIDGSRPDLSKFDALLGQMALTAKPSNLSTLNEMLDFAKDDGFVVL